MTRADKINAFLENGGVIVVSTYTKATQYDKDHAGMFFMKGDNLHVKSGKSDLCLSHGNMDMVHIAAFRYAE